MGLRPTRGGMKIASLLLSADDRKANRRLFLGTVGQASLPVGHVGQPFQAVILTGWKAGPTGAPPFLNRFALAHVADSLARLRLVSTPERFRVLCGARGSKRSRERRRSRIDDRQGRLPHYSKKKGRTDKEMAGAVHTVCHLGRRAEPEGGFDSTYVGSALTRQESDSGAVIQTDRRAAPA